MNVSALTVPAGTGNWKRVGWVLLVLAGLFAAGNAVMFLLVDGHGSADIKERFLATAVAGYAHGFGGAIAALIGPFQLITRLRTSWPKVHGWMGRIYLLAVLAGGLSGLYFGPQTSAGPVAAAGFTALAVFWLYSGTRAYISIRRGDVQAHRRWMLRNFALTLGAATLRIELPLLIIFGGLSFQVAYTIVAWSSWAPNWLIVEAWLRRRRAAVPR
jgi:uncharacterized membrane protein